MDSVILELRDIGCSLPKGSVIFTDISFAVNEGDILVLQGRSGSGKSTLLKCIAHLVLHSGQAFYRGSSPQTYGIPAFRAKVMYVPQRPSMLPGGPTDFLMSIASLSSHLALKRGNPGNSIQEILNRAFDISQKWGVDRDRWNRDWLNLSGGEAQRVLLAAAVSLNAAEILLLDEPTSALDSETSALVENYLVNTIRSGNTSLKALIWITHSPEQSRRVGTRFIYITGGGCYESDSFSSSPYPSTPIG